MVDRSGVEMAFAVTNVAKGGDFFVFIVSLCHNNIPGVWSHFETPTVMSGS